MPQLRNESPGVASLNPLKLQILLGVDESKSYNAECNAPLW
jgi:hypothetical protein